MPADTQPAHTEVTVAPGVKLYTGASRHPFREGVSVLLHELHAVELALAGHVEAAKPQQPPAEAVEAPEPEPAPAPPDAA